MKKWIRTYRAAVFLLILAILTAGVGSAAEEQSYNLADFLDSITITGAEINAEGQYVILEGVPYTVQMLFSEKTNIIQFDTGNGALTYQFPNGFTPQPAQGRGEMTGGESPVYFDYVIAGDMLTVTFDQTSPGYQDFIIAENAQFEIHATGVISEEEVVFSSEVTGEFEIDNEREVTVRKTGDYDSALNKVKYTIRADSKGSNTNVHIGDFILGTALTYDPTSLVVSSNISNPVEYTMDTRAGETFGITIPAMAHEEVVTAEYWADVNLDGLSSGAGVEVTGNTVTITSNEDPEGDDHTISSDDFQHRITLSTNSKIASSQVVREGKTYVTWTLVLNENANISIAGSCVKDTIEESSRQFMRYSGSGIHIERFEKDGTSAGTIDIPWGTGGLSNSLNGSSWIYTIPDADAEHCYRYVITYETEVDSEAFLQTTTVSNNAENEYDSDYGSTGVGTTGEEVEAEKSAVQSHVDADDMTAETEWEITFTVPPAGLYSAVIIDNLPGILDTVNNTWFYDELKSGSVRVEGLLEGEDFAVDMTSQLHQVSITFTKNNGESGLTGTGVTRTIHVYLTTTANCDWLEYAETESRARTHVNNAIVRLNGQDFYVTSSVSYNTTAYDIEKRHDGTYETSTNPALPIYLYKILLTGVNEGAFDEDGNLTITDDYDPEYLVYAPSYNTTETYAVNQQNGFVFYNNSWAEDPYETIQSQKGRYVVAPSSEGQLVFTLNKNELPKLAGSYYRYYVIVYALQVKDAETLARMRDEALHNEGLCVKLENTASNDRFGSTTIVTEYTVNVLEKTLLSEGDNLNTGTYDLRFQIDVNPDGLKIGEEDMITLKDTLSNLSFDYTSIEIEPQLEGDILNRYGNSIVFTLHNEKPYRITYTARLIGVTDVHWNNKADLYGRISGASGTASSTSGGTGTFYIYHMNVLKYAEGNMNQGLQASFELYEARVKDADGNDIPPDWKPVISEFTTDERGRYTIRMVYRDGSTEGQSLRPYSFHDADGKEQFGTGESYGWRYKIVETKAPEGYQLDTTEYQFGISDIPSYVVPYNYLNDDTVTIVNEPIGATEIAVPGKKVLTGRALEDQEFTFLLCPEEIAVAAWRLKYPEYPYPGADGSLMATNDAEGRFTFPLSYTYEDYLKGFDEEDGFATFYYVVREELPPEAVDSSWHGVTYDESGYLVEVKLFLDGGRLMTQTNLSQYVGEGDAAGN